MTPIDFANDRLFKRPECRVKAIDFCRAYHKTLAGDRERRRWPRWAILDALREQFTVGVDGDGVTFIAGLSFKPSRVWKADYTGRLILD